MKRRRACKLLNDRAAAEGFRRRLRDLSDAAQDLRRHITVKRADSPLHHRLLRDDVGCLPRAESAQGHDGGRLRVQLARRDLLKGKVDVR